jgi:hypothetical protein
LASAWPAVQIEQAGGGFAASGCAERPATGKTESAAGGGLNFFVEKRGIGFAGHEKRNECESKKPEAVQGSIPAQNQHPLFVEKYTAGQRFAKYFPVRHIFM